MATSHDDQAMALWRTGDKIPLEAMSWNHARQAQACCLWGGRLTGPARHETGKQQFGQFLMGQRRCGTPAELPGQPAPAETTQHHASFPQELQPFALGEHTSFPTNFHDARMQPGPVRGKRRLRYDMARVVNKTAAKRNPTATGEGQESSNVPGDRSGSPSPFR